MTMPDTTAEVWLPVPGFERFYQVSNLGSVRSLDRIDSIGRRQRGRVLKLSRQAPGDVRVRLCVNGASSTHAVSRLVAEAFHGAPGPGLLAMRTDGHEGAANIRWAAATDVAARRAASMAKAGTVRFSAVPIVATSLATGEEVHFDRIEDAVNAGFTRPSISLCLRGLRRSHRGYRWERAPAEKLVDSINT